MEITYRKAEFADAESIYKLSEELIYKYEDISAIDVERVLAWVRKKIENNIGEYVCVLADREKAGYYRAHTENGETELDDLYIYPQYQRRGIGTKIIEKCCSETEYPIFLYVFIKNIDAVRLYERLGFEITETVHGTRYIMRKN